MYIMNQNNTSGGETGELRVEVTNQLDNKPIAGAKISISITGGSGQTIEELTSGRDGFSDSIPLPAPDVRYSENANSIVQPYSEYNLIISAPGYMSTSIAGSELFAGQRSLQSVELTPANVDSTNNVIVIPPNTLWGNYPPKIPEPEVSKIESSGEVVLSRVVVPEYIIVHDGPPTDNSARNYYVRFPDYIKNVACSEIYSTWPVETIRANVLAITSFTLNRVYTEQYRNRGYDFTITSSTAFDHKWIYGRNIFDSISNVVDELYTNYLSRPNVKQPILTQYCDGKRVTCPNAMSQWGSKALGDDGLSEIEILRYYYGNSIYINTAEVVEGVPVSYPGTALRIGSSGEDVRVIQQQLNTISDTYTAIPNLSVDGVYGERTKAAVEEFQKIFGLTADGIVGKNTWYRISNIYVALTKIAEP